MERNNQILPAFSKVKISLVAPASRGTNEELAMLKTFTSLKLHYPENLVALNDHYFLANTDEKRLQYLTEALLDKDIKIIWCMRGGYGSARIIPDLYKLAKPTTEKTLIGYSDITALHLFLSQEWGWKTIHAAMPTELFKQEKQLENFTLLAAILTGEASEITLNDLKPLNEAAKNSENIKGLLTGGNLTIVQTSIGTKWQMNSKNKIVFFEDVDIKGYQLDRAFQQFLQSGIINDAKAIIFGEFVNGDDAIKNVLKEFHDQKVCIPVFKSSQFGHGKINKPLIYNTNSEIQTIGQGKYKLVIKNN